MGFFADGGNKMASHFFNNTLSQVSSQVVQGGSLGEIRVGRRMVQIKGRLAEGGFGVVELVCDPHTKQDMVLKRCNIDRPESFEIARIEINMLQKYKGPHVVDLLESGIHEKTRTSREALLLMEYCPGKHLLDRLLDRNGQHLPVDAILRMFGQICLPIKDMHNGHPAIVNRDLKLENVLFGQDGKVRLCDFGSCAEVPIYVRNLDERQAAEEKIAKETTQLYRAPEMVDLYLRPVLTVKTDIWALGCMLYAMCFLAHPFQDGSSLGILNAKITFPADSPYDPDTMHALILRLLDLDPECRPDINELIEWVESIAQGRGLPPQNLSEEALECRAKRLAADEVRQSKLSAKAAKAKAAKAPSKKPVAMSNNSVAARRLAMMRGQPVPESGLSSPFTNTDYNDDGADDGSFDPFGGSSAATSGPVSASARALPSSANGGFGGLDAFTGNGAGAGAGVAASTQGFDAFAPTSAAPAPAAAVDGFVNFGAATGGFDAFDAPPVSTAAPKTTASFQPSGFDNFGDAPAAAGFDAFAPTTAPIVATSGDGFFAVAAPSGDDGFGPPAPGSAAGGFDAFADDSFVASAPAAKDDGFGGFAPSSSLSVVSNDLVDIDESIAVPQPMPSSSAAAPAAALFNPFEDSEPAQGAPPRTQPTSAEALFNPFEDEVDTAATSNNHATSSKTSSDFLLDVPSTVTVTDGVLPLAPMLVPSRAPPPVPLDIFADDLLSPASTLTPGGFSAPGSVSGNFDSNASQKSRNPLDVLSLYDTPPPSTTAARGVMMGGPFAASPAGIPPAVGVGMFPQGVSPMGAMGSPGFGASSNNNSMKSGMGLGLGGPGMGMGAPPRPMGMPMGMGMGGPGIAPVGRGPASVPNMGSPSVKLPLTADTFTLGVTPTAPPSGASSAASQYGASRSGYGGSSVGSAGTKPDPFDSINLFQR